MAENLNVYERLVLHEESLKALFEAATTLTKIVEEVAKDVAVLKGENVG